MMDWNKLAGKLSKVVETAQSMGERAIDLSQKARRNIDTITTASEIVRSDDSLMNKGSQLAELAKPIISEAADSSMSSDWETIDIQKDDTSESDSEKMPITLGSSSDAVSALALMGTEIAKAVQACQIEETKRTEINARMEVEVTRINAISKLLSDYLNKTFDERAELFDNYFNVLDKAIASGDSELMAATLGSINSLAAQSPFKNLADLSAVQQQLNQGDALWDI